MSFSFIFVINNLRDFKTFFISLGFEFFLFVEYVCFVVGVGGIFI